MIDVEAAAAQLRLPDPADMPDADVLLLQDLIDAAVQRVADWLNRPLLPVEPAVGGVAVPVHAIVINSAIRRAVLILVARSYDERLGSDENPELGMPREVHCLLAPYRLFWTSP